MLEKHIEKKFVKHVKNMGDIILKVNTDSGNGWPDRLVLVKNSYTFPVPLFIEFKNERGVISPVQKYRIDLLLEKNVPVFVAYDYDQAIEFYERLKSL